ncbi:excalibur calcium-binding domain-containing protein [Salinicoccus sp. YB14-2]|uniref:excalibur calcium-binding domain-containing protein n=1 Tax=Salinicoccus sp. YB14-2 TaxID=1572701 RepID=UPI0026F47856|nr:excalibur calcium-binding domain-containing protein [Salinicoccus sp. YB14-2]
MKWYYSLRFLIVLKLPVLIRLLLKRSYKYNFAKCTELEEVFPDGVSSDHPAYHPKMDRDKDNHACE